MIDAVADATTVEDVGTEDKPDSAGLDTQLWSGQNVSILNNMLNNLHVKTCHAACTHITQTYIYINIHPPPKHTLYATVFQAFVC